MRIRSLVMLGSSSAVLLLSGCSAMDQALQTAYDRQAKQDCVYRPDKPPSSGCVERVERESAYREDQRDNRRSDPFPY